MRRLITHRTALRLGLSATVVVAVLAGSSGAVADETVQVCGGFYANNVFSASSSTPGFAAALGCPAEGPTGGLRLSAVGPSIRGDAVRWQTIAPAGLEIVGATANGISATHVNEYGFAYGGGFYWSGGGPEVDPTTPTTSGWVFPSPSTYFGMQLICGATPCGSTAAEFRVTGVSLYVRETSGPVIYAPSGLWQAPGWVRGTWPLYASGDSPSGVCGLNAVLNGQLINRSDSGQDVSQWHQCAAAAINQSLDTSRYGQGGQVLGLGAADAAGLSSIVAKTVYIDNTQPTVSFSGPTDAPTTAGTQYVTATATGGPSGISGILCSLDGGASRWYAASSAQIAVGGLGDHLVRCAAASNAVDAANVRGWSNWTARSLSIREPTVSFVSFAHVADALRCRRVRERVHIPAHWVTATYKGHPVRIKLPALRRTVKVVHCHPRIVRRRMRVHGHWRAVRAVVLPHTVSRSTIRVRHGAGVTVSGWLGTSNGNALGGQSVYILTAPDDGHPSWTQAAVATTTASGTWTANLPAGPSRLVMASYGGASTVEPAESTSARVVVPARVRLGVRPTSARWGGSIVISGRLKGGYIPAAGELVVLWIGWPGGSTEIGHVYTRSNGRFRTRYTFLRGSGTLTYRLWASTARESDYPYAPARSRRVWLTVGP